MQPSQGPTLNIPPGTDMDDPLAIFKLFLPDSLWETVVKNTNLYANAQRLHTINETKRPWHATTFNEIMVFLGILIYIGVHKEPQLSFYWRQDISQGPVHTVARFMSIVRFE